MINRIQSLLCILVLLLPVTARAEDYTRLVGLLITMEDLAPYVDENGIMWGDAFSAANGLRFICYLEESEEEGTSFVSIVDDGIASAEFGLSENDSFMKMDGMIFLVPIQDEELFFFNPVLQTADGRLFATAGDAMMVSADMLPGASVGQKVSDERTDNSTGNVEKTEVHLEIKNSL